jgi:hypothetical protein
MTDNEPRNCFKEDRHPAHDWEISANDGSVDENDKPRMLHYHCDGAPRETPDWLVHPPVPTVGEAEIKQSAILDARSAYGDKVQNQVEQAAMINAYLSGREVRPVDVPIIFILVKCHRLGKMPDYKDSYDDIEGYLDIAKLVIGGDMIEAATAKEYMAEKQRRANIGNQETRPAFMARMRAHLGVDESVSEGELIDKWRESLSPETKAWVVSKQPEGSGNPYANVPDTCPACRHAEHDGTVCLNMASDNECGCRHGQ